MPLALEPGEKFRVILESDKAKPVAVQPYFDFRYLSGREWKDLIRQINSLDESKDGIVAIDKVFDLIRKGLVGWGNMIDLTTGDDIPYDASELDRLLILDEAHELLVKLRNQSLNLADKKKFDLPLDSSTGRSARSAQVDTNAKTRQRK